MQLAAIPAALAGGDLLVSSQTGSGKTAAFLLPALQRLYKPSATGGMGPRVVERVMAYGDGWFPQPGRASSHEEFIARLEELRGAAAYAGRELPEMSAFGAKPDPATNAGNDRVCRPARAI